jgi:hypothetical protein
LPFEFNLQRYITAMVAQELNPGITLLPADEAGGPVHVDSP